MADDEKGVPESKWPKVFRLANRALRREIERAEKKEKEKSDDPEM